MALLGLGATRILASGYRRGCRSTTYFCALCGNRSRRGHPSPVPARIRTVDLARIAWVVTVLACLVAVAILLLQGYYGYAGVTLAVAVSAGINLT
jgi:hypothetical protein